MLFGGVIEANLAPSGSQENGILGRFLWPVWARANKYGTCSIRLLEVTLAYLKD